MDPFSTVWKMDSLLPTNFPALSLVCTRASAFFFPLSFSFLFSFFFCPPLFFFLSPLSDKFRTRRGPLDGKEIEERRDGTAKCLPRFFPLCRKGIRKLEITPY